MPRGQDPQPVRGGGLSPYVAQSLQQGKQQAENRLLAARQEQGANQRSQMQEQGATQRSQMQIKSQQAMNAANLEAEDRRAAEAEKARREDMEFRALQEKERQQFEASMQQADHDFQNAREMRDRKAEKEALDRMSDASDLQTWLAAENSRAMTGAILKVAEINGKSETAKERAQTQFMQRRDETRMAKGKYEQDLASAEQKASSDPELDKPIKAQTRTIRGRKEVTTGMGFGGPMKMNVPTTYEQSILSSRPQIDDVQQRLMSSAGSKIKNSDIVPENAAGLVQRIANNEISAEDIRAAVAALQGYENDLTRRAEEASGADEKDFWEMSANTVKRRRSRLNDLATNTTNIGGTKENVGLRYRSAMSPITGLDEGSLLERYMEQNQDAAAASRAMYQDLLGNNFLTTPVPEGLVRTDWGRERAALLNRSRQAFGSGDGSLEIGTAEEMGRRMEAMPE